MNTVTLRDSGQLLVDGQTIVDRPLMFLNAQILLTTGCTLRRFFR